MRAEGDLFLGSTNDGGEISIQDDFFIMDTGLRTATYLSLFGGNIEDNGSESTKNKSWWGNQLSSNEPNKKIISKTMAIIKGLPATPANLRKVELTANDDLLWFKSEGICDTINIEGKIPSKNRLELSIELLKDGNKLADYKFIENWDISGTNPKDLFPPVRKIDLIYEEITTTDGLFLTTSDGLIISSRRLEEY